MPSCAMTFAACLARLAGLSCALAALAPAAWAQAAATPTRGELLYATHCNACHTEQMHWRDHRTAIDWPSLKAQVRQWQGAALLNWTEEDILAVSRHLNDTIYHYPQPAEQLGLWTPQRGPRAALNVTP